MANSPDELKPTDTDEALNDPNFVADSRDQRADAGSPSSTGATQCEQKLQAELEQARDRLLRSQAELENFRRRAQREMHDERRYANQRLIVDLLPVLDNMERAIDAAEQNPESASLLQGFKMLHQLLLTTLENHNCRRVPADGVNFDPTLHEAVMQKPSDQPAGQVLQVLQRGYQLHDRVIRPAQVMVSSGAPPSESGTAR